jgi:hypothetical protein
VKSELIETTGSKGEDERFSRPWGQLLEQKYVSPTTSVRRSAS